MILENRLGSVRLKAEVTEDILPGVVNVPHGCVEANVNLLTDNSVADPVTGYPALKALLCRIKKA